MTSLTAAIRNALESDPRSEALDLHQLALDLHPAFPEFSISHLALEIARVAVAEGCRYLISEPPPD